MNYANILKEYKTGAISKYLRNSINNINGYDYSINPMNQMNTAIRIAQNPYTGAYKLDFGAYIW